MTREPETLRRQRRELANLGPLDQLRAGRLPRRLTQLLVGLAIYGISMAFVLRSTLGLIPWDVLHVGLAQHLPLTLGTVVIVVSLLVLLPWIPLRQQPGLGTIANALLIGLALDATLRVLGPTNHLVTQVALLVSGVALNAVATAMYIGAQFGPGPRDGLMTGLSRVTGRSIRSVRSVLEVVVVAAGWALGGVVGVGTVLYAITIGPMTQALLPWFTVDLSDRRGHKDVAGRRRP